MNAEIKSGENFLDETTKWVYADEKGVQVFALYGIGDGTDATPLYAVGGKQAVKEAKNINVYMEGSNNDGSTVDFERWLEVRQHSRMGQGGSVLQSGRGGRNGDENGRIHSGQHERNAGGAAERSSENQRGVKDQFSMRDPVEETRDLLALHNMTADNLRGALEPVRQPKEFSKFGNGALQQLVSEVGVQELARINAERQERLAVLDDVYSG